MMTSDATNYPGSQYVIQHSQYFVMIILVIFYRCDDHW